MTSIIMTDAGRTKYVADTYNRKNYRTCPFCHTGRIKKRRCQDCGTTITAPEKKSRRRGE